MYKYIYINILICIYTLIIDKPPLTHQNTTPPPPNNHKGGGRGEGKSLIYI